MGFTREEVDKMVKRMLADLKDEEKTLQGYVIAILYFKSGEFSKALKYVTRYLKVKTDSAVAYKLQGECYEKLNNVYHALESYHQSISFAEKKRQSKRKIMGRSNGVNKSKTSSKCTILKSSVMNITKKTTTKETTTKQTSLFNKAQGQQSSKVPAVTQSKLTQQQATFKYTVDNFTTLDCTVCSKAIVFCDLPWRIFVMPINDSQANRSLGIFLYCHGNSGSPSWSCNVAAELRLLSFKSDQGPYVRKLRHLFCSEEYNWGFQNFISWDGVLSTDNNYLENDCIVLEVHIVELPQQN